MFLPITTLCALVLSVFFIILSFRIFKIRREEKIAIGTGKNEILEYRVRAHANLVETAPLGLFLIILAELQLANIWILSLLTLAFVAGRLLHGYSFSYLHGDLRTRILGMQLTIFSMMGLCLLNLVTLLVQLFS